MLQNLLSGALIERIKLIERHDEQMLIVSIVFSTIMKKTVQVNVFWIWFIEDWTQNKPISKGLLFLGFSRFWHCQKGRGSGLIPVKIFWYIWHSAHNAPQSDLCTTSDNLSPYCYHLSPKFSQEVIIQLKFSYFRGTLWTAYTWPGTCALCVSHPRAEEVSRSKSDFQNRLQGGSSGEWLWGRKRGAICFPASQLYPHVPLCTPIPPSCPHVPLNTAPVPHSTNQYPHTFWVTSTCTCMCPGDTVLLLLYRPGPLVSVCGQQ